MSDAVKVVAYRITGALAALLWVVQVWRLLHDESLTTGPIALIWLILSGLFLLVIPWSADAHEATTAARDGRRTR